MSTKRSASMRWAAIAWLPLLALAACSNDPILESRNVGPEHVYPVEGTSYYLPKVLVRVEVWQFHQNVTRKTAEGQVARDESGNELRETLTHHFAVYDEARGGLRVVPDHRHQFVIRPRWDSASDDYVKVDMDADGLLKAVYGHATDERNEIARGVSDLFRMLIAGPGATSRWSPGERTGPRRALPDFAEEQKPRLVAILQFDPVDPVDGARAKQRLWDEFRIEMDLVKQPDCPAAGSGPGCFQTCDCTKPGIYYRLPIPYRFSLKPAGTHRSKGILGAGENGEWEYLEGGLEETILLPNEAVCLYVPVNRASFVSSYTSLNFERGMLTQVETDKPSELLGFVKIPVDAASAILAIPAELLTVRIKQTQMKSDLAEAERARNEAELRKVESELKFLEEMRKLQQPPNGANGAGGGRGVDGAGGANPGHWNPRDAK